MIKRALFMTLVVFNISNAQTNINQDRMITPLPTSIPYDKEKAMLGKQLYMDTSLSKDGKVSCNTCHDLKRYGVDNEIFSIGADGVLDEPFNSPTTFNSVFNFVQFWDGKAKNLADQAKNPFINPKEMALKDEAEVVKRVEANAKYKASFDKIYGQITMQNITDAIAEFEKTLITPNSPFSNFLRYPSAAALVLSSGAVSIDRTLNIISALLIVRIFSANKDEYLAIKGYKPKASESFFIKTPSLIMSKSLESFKAGFATTYFVGLK